mgnify:CR=1 FL=1|jgi:transcriptional regulator, lysR family
MHHDLQITRLRSLAAVVDSGGFRRAAEELCVTQPAISQQIRHLSRLIKAPVFVSTRRDIVLSPEGAELLAYSRRMLALNDEIVKRFVFSSRDDTAITFGVADQLGESFSEILRRLSAAQSGAMVTLHTDHGDALRQGIGEGKVDLALLLNQPAPATAREVHHLGNLKLNWFGRPDMGDELPLVLFREPCAFRGSTIQALESAGLRWRIGYECSDLTSLLGAVKAGMGVACLIANGDKLWSLPVIDNLTLPSPPSAVPLNLAVSTKGPTGAAFRIIKSAVQQALSDYPFELT